MTYSAPSHGYNAKDLIEANPVGIEYMVRNERGKEDFTNLIDKNVTKERLPWGFFGYTYLNHSRSWLNELLDQTPEFKKEVDLHEAMHTPDELETRYISKWMLDFKPREEILKNIVDNYMYGCPKN